MKKLILITLFTLPLFFSSCTKEYITEEYYTGGNADMQTIDFTIQSGDWVEYGTAGEPGYGFAVDLAMPEITQNVVQNGMVSLYFKSGESWIPVPVYFYNDSYQGGFIYVLKAGLFSIEYYESDHFTVRPDTQIFRLVIVQPI
jgi:hypothetical protein